ncbi:MAG: glycerophosphodiester phosphodiesterase [Candidatus Thorarchaeota archaeon]
MKKTEQPLVIAHRGSSVDAYANSKEAFNLAIEQKADMIELDTHLTKDGFFIVYHDFIIKHQGSRYRISDTNLETIQTILLPNNEPIPLLEDVLKEMLSKIRFNVEIKCKVGGKEFDSLLSRIGGDNSRILISSFKRQVLYNLRNSNLGYSLAFLCIHSGRRTKSVVQHDFVDAINPYYKYLRKEHVKYYHENKKKVFTWTVNKEKDINDLIDKKVDGIITDNPKKTRQIIQDYKS